MYRPTEPKIQKLCVKIGDTRREFSVSASDTEGLSNAEGGSATGDEFELDSSHAIVPHVSSNRSASDTGQESAGPVGSTVADAIYAQWVQAGTELAIQAVLPLLIFPKRLLGVPNFRQAVAYSKRNVLTKFPP